jgi:hypothetical protein
MCPRPSASACPEPTLSPSRARRGITLSGPPSTTPTALPNGGALPDNHIVSCIAIPARAVTSLASIDGGLWVMLDGCHTSRVDVVCEGRSPQSLKRTPFVLMTQTCDAYGVERLRH